MAFLWVSVAVWIISIAFVRFHQQTLPGPEHGLPGAFRDVPFVDLTGGSEKMDMIHRPEFFSSGVPWKWIYPAPCVFVYKFLLIFRHGANHQNLYSIAYYLAFVAVGVVVMIWLLVAGLESEGISRLDSWPLLIATVAMSWPLTCALDRGNIEALLWMVVAAAVWAYSREMWWASALLIGVVASFKIYPILLLGLFVARRKYLQAAASLFVFLAISIGSLAYFGPTIAIAYHRISAGVNSFLDFAFYPAAVDREWLTFDHSLVSLFRILTTAHPKYMHTVGRFYVPFMSVVMATLFFAIVLKMPRLNQLLIISIAIVLLPPKSYDYTLLMLYIPWAWLAILAVSAQRRSTKIPGMMSAMVLLALICSPEFFIKFRGFYSSGQFKTICLLALLWVAVRYPFPDSPSPSSNARAQPVRPLPAS